MNAPTARRNEWASPAVIIAVVMALGNVINFYTTFDRRVSDNETRIEEVSRGLTEHKAQEAETARMLDAKLDRLIQFEMEKGKH